MAIYAHDVVGSWTS